MRVILVKLIAGGFGSGARRCLRWCSGARPSAPGEFLVPGVVDSLGQELLGLGDEPGQGVQPDGGVAEPVGGAEPGELVDRVGEDRQTACALRPHTVKPQSRTGPLPCRDRDQARSPAGIGWTTGRTPAPHPGPVSVPAVVLITPMRQSRINSAQEAATPGRRLQVLHPHHAQRLGLVWSQRVSADRVAQALERLSLSVTSTGRVTANGYSITSAISALRGRFRARGWSGDGEEHLFAEQLDDGQAGVGDGL